MFSTTFFLHFNYIYGVVYSQCFEKLGSKHVWGATYFDNENSAIPLGEHPLCVDLTGVQCLVIGWLGQGLSATVCYRPCEVKLQASFCLTIESSVKKTFREGIFGQPTSEKLMKQYECHLKGGQWCRHWLERCDDDNDCEDDEHNVDNVCTRRWWHWIKITTMTIVTMRMTATMMKVMLTMFACGEYGIEDNNDNNTNSDDDENENVDNVCTSSHLCCFLLQSQQKPPLSI